MSEQTVNKVADISPKLLKKHEVTKAKVAGITYLAKEIDTKFGESHAFKGNFGMIIEKDGSEIRYESKTAFLPKELAQQLVQELINRADTSKPIEFATIIEKVDSDTAIGYQWDCTPTNMKESEDRLDKLLTT